MPTQRLIYTNENGESVEFSPFSVFTSNIATDVVGLGDVSAQINTVSTIGQDGSTWVSTVIQSRDITIKGFIKTRDFGLQGGYRRRLNHVLNPKFKGTLTYIFGDISRKISCYAEKAPTYGSDNRYYKKFTVDLVCPDPYWYDAESETESSALSGWEDTLVFPLPAYDEELDHESPEANQEWPIVFGARLANAIYTLKNEGDAEGGMTIIFSASSTVRNPKILNVETGEYFRVLWTLNAGDTITVNTTYGEKKVLLNDTTNIFRYVDSGSTFLQMSVGDNLFQVSSDDGAYSLDVYIEFASRYLGV